MWITAIFLDEVLIYSKGYQDQGLYYLPNKMEQKQCHRELITYL